MANIRKPLLDEDGFPIREGGGGSPIDAILDGDDDWPSINTSGGVTTTTSNTQITETGGGSVTVQRVEPTTPDGQLSTNVIVEQGNNAQLNITTENGQVKTATLTGVRDENNQGDGIPQATGDGTLTVINSSVAPGESIDLTKEGVDLGAHKNVLSSMQESMEDMELNTGEGGDALNSLVTKANNTNLNQHQKQKISTTGSKGSPVAIPNLMHDLSSYTYNISLFILGVEDYNAFADDPTYNIEEQPGRLLIKTGGSDPLSSSRNPFFRLDFFIDDLEIDSIISPGGANKGSVNTGVSFNIREPYGMTLLNSFVMAANDLGSYNYIDQPYLLKVQLTGYDSQGKHIGNWRLGERTRYIPIRFTDFKFTATEQGTTYSVTAIPYNSVGLQNTKSTIPVDLQIEAKTIDDFFNVALQINEEIPTRPSPNLDEFGGTGKPVIQKVTEKGLTGYLNKLEQEHLKKKLKAVPDVYAFVFDPDIKSSKIVLQDAIDLSKTKNEKDPSKKAQSQFLNNFNFDETTKTYSIRAGTSFIDVIHSMLRSSEYMTKQVVSADLKKDKGATEEYEDNQDKPIDFYRIVPQIKLGPFDAIRNQYSKIITYYVKKFEMTGKDYENLGKKPVEFIAKNYDYYYTGKNTDILSFDIEFNAAYFQTYTYNKMQKAGKFPTPSAETDLENTVHEGQTAKVGNSPSTKWTPFIREVVTNTKTSKDINDPQTSHEALTVDSFMQDVFDQGADLLHMNMSIIGDMSYIQSKDLRSVSLNQKEDYYLPDGSLNTDKEWHVFVKFRNPTDVNAETGLMKGFNINEDGITDVNVPSISGQYRIVKVTSKFGNGQFTQNLETIRERNQELNTLKEKDKKKAVNERKNKDTDNNGFGKDKYGEFGPPKVKNSQGLTSDQRGALSSMGNYNPDATKYTPDTYMTPEERGNLPDKTIDLGDGVEAVGTSEWNPKPGTVVNNNLPSATTGTTDDFLNDQNQEEIEFDIELNEGTT